MDLYNDYRSIKPFYMGNGFGVRTDSTIDYLNQCGVIDIIEAIRCVGNYITISPQNLKKMVSSKFLKLFVRNQIIDASSPYLFAFINGVYDLKNKTFRLPTCEEYICSTTGYKYQEPDQKYIDELEKIIGNIFLDP
jgi:phage/plasmid-associated DNA primase